MARRVICKSGDLAANRVTENGINGRWFEYHQLETGGGDKGDHEQLGSCCKIAQTDRRLVNLTVPRNILQCFNAALTRTSGTGSVLGGNQQINSSLVGIYASLEKFDRLSWPCQGFFDDGR
jgi:hypothetical protein